MVANVPGVVHQFGGIVGTSEGGRLLLDLRVLNHLVLPVQTANNPNSLGGERLFTNLRKRETLQKQSKFDLKRINLFSFMLSTDGSKPKWKKDCVSHSFFPADVRVDPKKKWTRV